MDENNFKVDLRCFRYWPLFYPLTLTWGRCWFLKNTAMLVKARKKRLFTFNYWNFVQSETTLSGSLISSKLLRVLHFSHEIHIDWMTLQRSTTEVETKWNSCMVLSANMKKMMVLLQLTSQKVQLKVPLSPSKNLAGLDSNSICIVAGHLQQALQWSEVATARSFTLKEALWLT